MTSLISGALQRRELILPEGDQGIADQFTTYTDTLSGGNVIDSKGNDRLIGAGRCALLVREQGRLDPIREETASLMPVLTNPVLI